MNILKWATGIEEKYELLDQDPDSLSEENDVDPNFYERQGEFELPFDFPNITNPNDRQILKMIRDFRSLSHKNQNRFLEALKKNPQPKYK